MKCPIRPTLAYNERELLTFPDRDCLQEECAWWRQEYPACAIYSMERALWAIATELGTIMQRLPKGGKT